MAKFEKIPTEDWLKIDPEQMPSDVKKAYAEKQEADEIAKQKREKFEHVFSAALAKAGKLREGHLGRFGYNFGQLSLADPAKGYYVVPKAQATKVATASIFG